MFNGRTLITWEMRNCVAAHATESQAKNINLLLIINAIEGHTSKQIRQSFKTTAHMRSIVELCLQSGDEHLSKFDCFCVELESRLCALNATTVQHHCLYLINCGPAPAVCLQNEHDEHLGNFDCPCKEKLFFGSTCNCADFDKCIIEKHSFISN